MKIIQQGTLPEEITYRVDCSNCRTIFEFEQREGRVVYDQRDGNAVVINCPTCNKEVWKSLRTPTGNLDR